MKTKKRILLKSLYKTALIITIASFCTVYVAASAVAEDEVVPFSMADKLNRGFNNTAMGWMEIPNGIEEIGNRYGSGAAATLGLLHGTGKAIQKTAYGIFEILTFPLNIRLSYEAESDESKSIDNPNA
ncbi:MAG: putative exosortase-associated protein (TIGR04073 family) [Candidatus Omnitrophota bacterium]|jgi:putative exosortase-associated protein (TIGR04073 family)